MTSMSWESEELDRVIGEAAALLTPSKEERERVERVAGVVLEKVKAALEYSRFRPETVLGGSYARDTWLPREADIDVFLRYPTDVGRVELEEDSYMVSCKAFGEENLVVRYAEHPYTETYVEGVRVNVVPCYRVEAGRWITAADRSPYHLEFVKRNLKGFQTSDVRLLKGFMKGQGIYGAEIKVGGFSGYMCETLVYRYGSFKSLLEEASRWKIPLIVTDEDKVEEVRERFRGDKIVITDPVDPNRNLGRALSMRSLAKFVLACRSFLRKPSREYFMVREKSVDRVRLAENRLLENVIVLEFEHEKMSADILWGMLYRTMNHFIKQFNVGGFKVARATAVSDEERFSAYIFLFETTKVSEYECRKGPYVFDEENLQRFVDKNFESAHIIWVNEEGKACALRSRNVYTAKAMLDEILRNPIGYGASRGIAEQLKKGKVYCGRRVMKAERDEVLKGVMELLEPSERKYFC